MFTGVAMEASKAAAVTTDAVTRTAVNTGAGLIAGVTIETLDTLLKKEGGEVNIRSRTVEPQYRCLLGLQQGTAGVRRTQETHLLLPVLLLHQILT